MTFLPEGYNPNEFTGSAQGDYYKIEQGENKLRVLSETLTFGFEYWTNDKKPKRLKEKPPITPADLGINPNSGKPNKINHIWVMHVWDYRDSKVKILSFHQASLITALTALFKNPDWGHPSGYDITITKTGTKMDDTKYSAFPSPHKALTPEQEKAIEDKVKTFDLNSIFNEPQPLPQASVAPQAPTNPYPFVSGAEGVIWAVKQGIPQDVADKLLADINAHAESVKALGTPMSNNERRDAFIKGVQKYFSENPEAKAVKDEIPF